jgi:Na+/H+-dicarboxylate symporter
MATSNSRMMHELQEKHGLNRPSVSRLLAHIFSSVLSNGIVSLLVLGSAVIFFLRYYNIPSSNSFALLFSTTMVLAFLRGCKAWQEDLNDYQKALADARHTYQPGAR